MLLMLFVTFALGIPLKDGRSNCADKRYVSDAWISGSHFTVGSLYVLLDIRYSSISLSPAGGARHRPLVGRTFCAVASRGLDGAGTASLRSACGTFAGYWA